MSSSWQSQLNGFFDKIYVITIERAVERHEHIRSALKGVDFEFFYGTDKHTLDPSRFETDGIYDDKLARSVPRYEKSLSVGEIACSLSHRSVYADIIKHSYRRCLIFEDDVVALEEGMKELGSILAAWPEDAGLVYMGYWRRERWKVKQHVKTAAYLLFHYLHLWGWNRFTAYWVRNMYARPLSKHFKRAGFHDGAHAYALSLDTAKALLKLQTPVAHSADHLLAYHILHERHSNCYLCVPKVFDQENHIHKEHLVSIRSDIINP